MGFYILGDVIDLHAVTSFSSPYPHREQTGQRDSSSHGYDNQLHFERSRSLGFQTSYGSGPITNDAGNS